MSNQTAVVTGKITPKKSHFLHEVFVDGVKVAQRKANKTYKAAWVVKPRPDALVLHYQHLLREYQAQEAEHGKGYSVTWAEGKIAEIEKNGTKAEVVTYSNHPENIRMGQSIPQVLREIDQVVYFEM